MKVIMELFFYQGRTDFTKRFPKRRLYTTEPKRIAKSGSILMSVRAPVGDINIADEDCCIGRGLCALKSKNNTNSFLLYLLFNLKEKLNVFNSEGTVFGAINKENLKNMKVVYCIESLVLKFDEAISIIDKKYYNLEKESKTLLKIRDTLLPKLMSGEIRVPLESESKV
jgi:type I restriction enzyme S subunit